MIPKAKPRCRWRGRHIAWCRKYGKFCDPPREYEYCLGYEPVKRLHETLPFAKVSHNIRVLKNQIFPAETKGPQRTYKFCLRFLDGIRCFISEGKDVSDASEKLEKHLPIKGAEFSAIIDSVEIWNTKEKRWVPHRPWWEEEKEPYEWEAETRSWVQIPGGVQIHLKNKGEKNGNN